MKKYLLILILFICTLITSCTLPEQNQGNDKENQNDASNGISYIVSFNTNCGSFIEPQCIKEGDVVIKPNDPSKENFSFVNWMLNEEEYDFSTPVSSNITLIATWEEIGVHTHFYTTSVVEPTCTEKGYTEYICECGESYKDDYVEVVEHDMYTLNHRVPTASNPGYSDIEFCANCLYYEQFDFVLSLNVVDLVIYEFNDQQFINFGSYPQSHVADVFIIEELNKITETNDRGYYEYNGNEYIKIVSTPLYGEKTYIGPDYGYKYNDGAVVYDGITEWFKVEPIIWRILTTNEDGSYLLLSDLILDSSVYCDDLNELNKHFYPTSYIRDYLNNDFINDAFTSLEQNYIQTTELNNKMPNAILNDPHYCYDKVFLLSYEELCDSNYGFSDDVYDINRRAGVTDYAIATGVRYENFSNYEKDSKAFVEYNGIWWYRNGYSLNGLIEYVTSTGKLTVSIDTTYDYVGVRPAITIKLNK